MPYDICCGPGGTWSPYYLGVCLYILEHIPFKRDKATMYTVSGGGLGLGLLLYDSPQEFYDRARGACNIMGDVKKYGIFAPRHMGQACRQALEYFLPPDAHLRLGNRVAFGISRWLRLWPPVPKPLVADCLSGPFETREELIDAIMASSYIPLFFLAPSPHPGCIDGGFSHNYPPDSEDALRIGISDLPPCDVCLHDNSHHLDLGTYERYMELFWIGYRTAKEHHPAIVQKLRGRGL